MHGKCAEGGKESDGIIIARRSGSADRAKCPGSKTIFQLNARQSRHNKVNYQTAELREKGYVHAEPDKQHPF